jgi:5-(carboxyamino)imidazole ribonucleotide synthase
MSDDSRLVAVLGGGQLGRMLALSGIPMGLRFRFLDPSAAACAQDVGDLVVGALDDQAALDAVANGSHLVTYEWEGVPAASVEYLSDKYRVSPGAVSLRASQDRLTEKELFVSLGIPTAPFAPVASESDLREAIGTIGLPVILKTRRGGYDGLGQVLIESHDAIGPALATLHRSQLIVEGRVPFDRELSVIATRAADGTVVTYPPVHNEHRDGILRVSRAPVADLDPGVAREAEAIIQRILDSTGHIGTLCVELFQIGSQLFANEFAPRVHNSGHWTIEGARTSQFENHLRAGLGWPLGSAAAHGCSAMVNCIGRVPDRAAVLAIPGTHLHEYAKAARRGRKVGHVSITARHEEALEHALAQLLAVIGNDG